MTSEKFHHDISHRAFFGRRRGKRLHPGQQTLFDELLPQLEIKLAHRGAAELDTHELDPHHLDPHGFFESSTHRLGLEIGYGGGEHLARMAADAVDTNFIGCEVFSGGIGKMLEKIDELELQNVRLFTEDAYELLATLQPASLDFAYLLYPDPWPKSKHHKRRFVSRPSLDALAHALKPGAKFRFATDIEDYANWTLGHIERHPDFYWPICAPGSWHQPYPGWQATRYEQKARKEGRLTSFYFTFVRR